MGRCDAWVGEDLGAGVAWALANPREAIARVARGQDYLQQRFAPELIGRKWLQVLGLDAEINASRAPPARPSEP